MPITSKNETGRKRPQLEKEGKKTYMTLPQTTSPITVAVLLETKIPRL